MTSPSSWGQNATTYDVNCPSSMSQDNSNFYIYGAVSAQLYADWALSSSSTLTIGNGVTATTVTVPSSYTLTTGSATTLNGLATLAVANGGTVTNSAASALTIKGSLLIDGTFNHTSSSTPAISGSGFIKVGTVAGSGSGLFVNSSTNSALGTLTGTFTINGTYKYASNASATLPLATWGTYGSIYISSVIATAPTLSSKTFYNVTWDCSGQTAALTLPASSLVINGTLTVKNTGTTGTLSFANTASGTTFNIGGSYVQTGGKVILSTSTATYASSTIVSGDVSISGGTLTLSAGSYTGTLSIGGNFSATAGTINATSTAAGALVYAKSGTQIYTGGAGYSGTINTTINSGSTLNIGTATYGVTGSFTNNGAVAGTGIIKLTGSASQTISGTGTITNLTVSGSGGAVISTTPSQSVQSITGVLSVGSASGNSSLNTGVKGIILKSTSVTNSAVVDQVYGTITGTVQVERYIQAGYRGYRDMAPEVYGAGTINANWQEGAISGTSNTTLTNPHAGYGIFITGTTTAGTAYGMDANGFDISGTSAYNTQDYTYVNGTWTPLTSTTDAVTGALDAFKGYRLLIRGDRSSNMFTTSINEKDNVATGMLMYNATTLRATGKLITGDVTYNSDGVVNAATGVNTTTSGTATHANALNPIPNGFSMVANPYVCPVQWSTVYLTPGTANINGSYWYLDPTYSATGKYIAYNAVTGSNSTATNTTYIDPITNLPFTIYNSQSVLGNIQAGQAVFVQSLGATPQVVFQEAAKAPSSTKTSVFGTATLSKIYVSLLKQATSSTTYNKVDGAAVAFRSDFGNTTYGPQDAIKFSGASDNLSISNKGKNLSIDGRLPATASDAIALVISKPTSKAYQLQVDANAYTNNGFAPILYDAYKNTTKALSTGITTVDVTIDTAVAASYSNRFTILFAPSALPVNSIVASASLSNKVATINWNTVGEKSVVSYVVEKSTDAKTYATLATTAAKNTAANYSVIDNSVTATTYYRIKAVSTTGSISYSNVAKVQLTVNGNQYTVYPNPLKGKILNVSMDNVASGKYTVSIYNALGVKVSEQTISHTGGSATHALTINNTLAAGAYNVSIREANSKQLVHQSTLSVQP